MPFAARVTDMTSHSPPLSPGPGSLNVFIGFLPAWRALPAAMGGAVDAISNSMNSFMMRPQMTPVDATASIAQISANLVQGGVAAAAAGSPAAATAASTSVTAVNTANVALTTAWTAASAVPGGQPAANIAYTEGIKAAMAESVSSNTTGATPSGSTIRIASAPPASPASPTSSTSAVSVITCNTPARGSKRSRHANPPHTTSGVVAKAWVR